MTQASVAVPAFKTLQGTAIGAAGGFMVGGPLGALIGTAFGAVAGAAADFSQSRTRKALAAMEAAYADISFVEAKPVPSRATETAFTIGVIALGAKLARLGKRLDRDTIEQFRTAFKLPPSDVPMIRRMFEQALFDSVGHKPYADQLATLFAAKPDMLEALLQGLARFAKADGETVSLAVLEYLGALASRFGVAPQKLDEILRREGVGQEQTTKRLTAFEILGVPSGAPEIVVKQAYRGLIMECHPDKLHATNDDPKVLQAANDKMAKLNAAYAEIRKARGWN